MLQHCDTSTPARKISRQQRRAAERRAAKEARRRNHRPLEKHYNHIRFHELNKVAYRNVVERLVGYGNKLSTAHRDGLMFQAGIFTMKAQRRLPGRHQITLAPGVGKTEGVVSWIKALVGAGHDHVGVAVAASKVEELCVIKRKLLEVGVPANRVGLRHEYRYDADVAKNYKAGELLMLPDDHASEPSEGHERQILLITHARVMQSAPETYHLYKGAPRMVVYDEALVKSKAAAIPLRELDNKVHRLRTVHGHHLSSGGQQALDYLTVCLAAAQEAHERVKETGQGQVIDLPPIDPADAKVLRGSMPKDKNLDHLRDLLDLVAYRLKMVDQSNGTGGLVTYEIVIPDCLDNVAILDASYPVRDLVQRDRGIVPGETTEDVRAAFKGELDIAAMDLHKIKRYDHVIVRQMRVPGGRTSMTEDFDVDPKAARKEDSKVCMEVADVISALPADQSVLVFTFKDRDGVRFRSRIEDTLRDANVDLHATVQVNFGRDRVETRRRVNILTWGQETAVNDYAHCEHVILAGVIRRNRLELEGSILGQGESLDQDVTSQDVSRADLGEVLHAIYQALNRGTCRVMRDGQAAPMTAWVLHKHKNIQAPLTRVMPGIKWEKWKPKHFEPFEGSMDAVADKILEYLTAELPIRNLSMGTVRLNPKISFKALRAELGMGKGQPNAVPDRSWTAGRALADDHLPAGWIKEGRSYVQMTAERLGFTPVTVEAREPALHPGDF